jgi:hypothetical protein
MTYKLASIVCVWFLAGTLGAAQSAAPVFKWEKLQIQDGEDTKQINVTVVYEDTGLRLTSYKNAIPERVIPYSEITSAEYTFGKSPRVSAALLVSPLFLFSSSKSHWLNIKHANDYTLLRVEKGHYKLMIAELEKRAAVTVQATGEDK